MKKQRVIIFHELHVGVEYYCTKNHNGYLMTRNSKNVEDEDRDNNLRGRWFTKVRASECKDVGLAEPDSPVHSSHH